MVGEAKEVKRGSGLEHLRARINIAPWRKAVKRLKLRGLRQWKNAPREHPDDEFFGFTE